jgi:hydrogenase expression/formation protein HypE
MAQGAGGRAGQALLNNLILRIFDDPSLKHPHDSAALPFNHHDQIVFTTDSFVIQPLFFPGGDIGSLAVHGTMNDLAMAGAAPLYLSVSLIIEEGFSLQDLERILTSMKRAADAVACRIVTGDTKVVERGACDGLYICTSGIGQYSESQFQHGASPPHPLGIQPEDSLLLSGDLGRHAVAVMSARENLSFSSSVESDSMAIWPTVRELISAGVQLHCMRDITRGGLAAILNELAQTAQRSFTIEESKVGISPKVLSVCEVLGYDPLHLACEGRFLLCIPPHQTDMALEILQEHNQFAALIGRVDTIRRTSAPVISTTPLGGTRVLSVPAGELLPRIC